MKKILEITEEVDQILGAIFDLALKSGGLQTFKHVQAVLSQVRLIAPAAPASPAVPVTDEVKPV